MGDEFEIPAKGIGKIDHDNGYFNKVLYVPNIAAKLIFVYQITHKCSNKRVTFNQDDMEIL